MLNVASLEGAAEIEAATVIAKMVNAVKNFIITMKNVCQVDWFASVDLLNCFDEGKID